MLTLLTSAKKVQSRVDYERKYLEEMIRAIKTKQLEPDNIETTKRIVFYTVKYLSVVDVKELSRENMEGLLIFNQMLLNEICELTPSELMTIFPVTKSYDGEKYQCKDYFSTMEALRIHGLNEPIRLPETATSLLCDYMNPTVMMCRVHCMSVVSKLHHMNTGQSLMLGDDGQSFPVKKPVPRYLRLIQ